MPPRKPLSTAGLASAMATIEEARTLLVTRGTAFNHSFDAAMAKIRPDPAQPRKAFPGPELAELARTMQVEGQLQPILLRPDPEARGGWIIVAGERRWRAAQLNGWPRILAMESTGDHEVATLLENLQRIDLTPVEEARGIRRLLAEKGWSQARAAEALGKSKSEISSLLRILDLPQEILDGVSTSKLALPRNVLAELARVAAGPLRDRLLARARSGELTLRMIRDGREAAAAGYGETASGERGTPDWPDAAAERAEAARSVGPRSLHRLADQLRALREAQQGIDAAQWAALLRLRDAIDGLLAAAGEAAK